MYNMYPRSSTQHLHSLHSVGPVASVEPPPSHRPRCSPVPPRSAHAWTSDRRPARQIVTGWWWVFNIHGISL